MVRVRGVILGMGIGINPRQNPIVFGALSSKEGGGVNFPILKIFEKLVKSTVIDRRNTDRASFGKVRYIRRFFFDFCHCHSKIEGAEVPLNQT